jgi:hypothetical protein
MIQSDAELSQTIRAMERLYLGLAAIRRDVFPRDERYFALMAEGPVDELRKLQREVDEYVGFSLAEKLDDQYWGHLRDREDATGTGGAPVKKAATG